jgi:toxin ParE1/3/4
MKSYVLRPAARAKLASIWRYTAEQWGTEQADKYVGDIVRQIERITEFPEMGSGAEGLDDHYRKVRSGYHRVFYRTEGSEIIVVRVLHAKEDVPDDLGD